MPLPLYISLANLHTEQTGWHEKDFTAHGYSRRTTCTTHRCRAHLPRVPSTQDHNPLQIEYSLGTIDNMYVEWFLDL